MSAKVYTVTGYIMMIAAVVIAYMVWMQGGKVIDVGKAVANNNLAIVETNKAAVAAKDTAIIAKERVDEIEKKLGLSIMQDKETLSTVLRGRDERYKSQELYLVELEKMRQVNLENQQKINNLEETVRKVSDDHKARLKAAEDMVKEVRGLRKQLDNCVGVKK